MDFGQRALLKKQRAVSKWIKQLRNDNFAGLAPPATDLCDTKKIPSCLLNLAIPRSANFVSNIGMQETVVKPQLLVRK